MSYHVIRVNYVYDPRFDGTPDPQNFTEVFDVECHARDSPLMLRGLCRQAVRWIAGQEQWCRDRQDAPRFSPTLQITDITLDSRRVSRGEIERISAGGWW